MNAELKFVFEPLRVKFMEVPNRIAMPSMHLNFTPTGEITDKFVAFYRERAKGGVGLIIIGGCSIDETAGGSHLVGLSSDKFIGGLRWLTDAVHAEGKTKIAAQLYHAGRYAVSFLIGRQPVAPSAIASKLTREKPMQLTIEEIRNIEDDFAEAAFRAKRANFDAVEILGSAGYLISQFLSPLTNQREDDYGGSFENRIRFGVEVIKKVREAVGEDFPVMVRLGGSDFVRGGNTSKDMLRVAKAFSDAGVDMFNITGGWHETHVPQIAGIVPRAGFAYLAAGVRKVTGKPTIVSNRIATIELAERLLIDGWGDMVNMGRPLIADPYLVRKALEGGNVRPCIACNQLCFDSVFTGKEVGCTVNAVAGKETKYSYVNVGFAKIRKKIVVVGAGPAGMSFAIEAARRGHKVVIFEKSDRIGGQLNVASMPSDKHEFACLIIYYQEEARRLGIDIRTGKEVTELDIVEENPDEVIFSTGGVPIIPAIDGVNLSIVSTAEEVLKSQVSLKDKIVIIGGGAVAVDVATYIVDHSQLNGEQAKFLLKWDAEDCDRVKELLGCFRDVTIVEMLAEIGKDIGKTTRWISLKNLFMSGVKILTNTKAKRIEQNGVIVENREKGEFKILAQQVILAVGYRPNNEFITKLKDKLDCEVCVIGDAKKVGKLPDAIHEGFELGISI